MSEAALVCWKCGHSLASLTLPLRRLEECPQCHAELHVCRLCEWYDTRVAKSCREPIADEVKNKDRANFCDYFKPRAGAYQARDVGAAVSARSQLDALFGGGAGPAAPAPAKDAAVEADRAKAELERLFGPKR
jgi:hypothetical protein